MSEEVDVIRLPTIGEAYSEKTWRKGKKKGEAKTLEIRDFVKDQKIGGLKTRHPRQTSINEHKFNARRVLAYKHSSESQKKVAQDLLNGLESGDMTTGLVTVLTRTLSGIVRTMSYRYRDF